MKSRKILYVLSLVLISNQSIITASEKKIDWKAVLAQRDVEMEKVFPGMRAKIASVLSRGPLLTNLQTIHKKAEGLKKDQPIPAQLKELARMPEVKKFVDDATQGIESSLDPQALALFKKYQPLVLLQNQFAQELKQVLKTFDQTKIDLEQLKQAVNKLKAEEKYKQLLDDDTSKNLIFYVQLVRTSLDDATGEEVSDVKYSPRLVIHSYLADALTKSLGK